MSRKLPWQVLGALVPAAGAFLFNPFPDSADIFIPAFVFLLFLGFFIAMEKRQYPPGKQGFQRDSENRR